MRCVETKCFFFYPDSDRKHWELICGADRNEDDIAACHTDLGEMQAEMSIMISPPEVEGRRMVR